jgi:transcriptional regulator with XRE-family HTH domain
MQFAGVNNTRNNEYLTAFGLHFRELRKSKNISVERLALSAGIEYSQIFDIEHGKINTTISIIHVLARTLEIKETEFFDFQF